MKKIFGFILSLLAINISLASFSDIKYSPYSWAIASLWEKWIINGYPDWTFRPKANITRAELVKIFFEAKKIKKVMFYGCFWDVTVDSWFAQSVCQSRQMWLVSGYPNWSFKPNNNATFAEWVKIWMWIFWTKLAPTTSWRAPYIKLVEDKNIFGKKISSYSLMTREQAAQLAFALIKQYQPTISSSSSSSRSVVFSSSSSKISVSSSSSKTSSSISSAWSLYSSSSSSKPINISLPLTNKSTILPRDFKNTISLGCWKPAPSIIPTSSVVNWVTRHYITDVPASYNSGLPTKLIIGFHGRTNSNKQFRDYTKIHTLTNAIVVYPSALPEATSPRNWMNAGDKPDYLRDFAFFDQIVIDMSEKYCIDKSQIYIMWHSLWAWFSNTLGCARWDIIAWVWTVGWSVTKASCVWNPDYMIMHNPADNLASFVWWVDARDYAIKQNWCNINTSKPYWDWQLNCIEYSCSSWSMVWCPHNESNTWWYYYPHTWPKNATKIILDFFSKKNW